MKYLLLILLCLTSAFALQATLLDTDPSPAIAGDYVDITIRLTADADEDTLEDVTFGIDQTAVITPITPPEFVGNIFASQTISRTFRVFIDDLPQGTITIPVKITTDGVERTQFVDLAIQESTSLPQLRIGSIDSTPNELLPDTDDNELTITLQNLGDQEAQLITANLVIEQHVTESYAFSMQDSLASLESGEEGDLTFTVDVDEFQGGIPATLDVSYRSRASAADSYTTYTEQILFALPIADAPFLEVTNVELLDEFASGSADNRVRITFTNTGNAEAEEVRVRVMPDISFPFIFTETTRYVAANIDPGQSASVQFQAEVLESAIVDTYNIQVRAESLVGQARYTRDDQFDITTTQGRNVSSQTIGLTVLGLIILASIIIAFLSWRRNK